MFIQTGIEFRETKMKDYILTREDPKKIIPRHLLPSLWIKETDDYIRFLKEYGELTEYLKKFEKKLPKEGDIVRIIGGKFGSMGLEGTVKSVGKRVCEVETTVFGNMIKISVPISDVEVLEKESEE